MPLAKIFESRTRDGRSEIRGFYGTCTTCSVDLLVSTCALIFSILVSCFFNRWFSKNFHPAITGFVPDVQD
jgi:hypothetical protein